MATDGITDEELAAMKARVEATTAGPWKPSFEGRDHWAGDSVILTGDQDIYVSAEDYKGGGGHFCADLDFIAHARQDVPRLISEVEKLRALRTVSMAPIDKETDGLNRLDSSDLAGLVVDALLRASIVREADVERALKIATEEIDVRKTMGDY